MFINMCKHTINTVLSLYTIFYDHCSCLGYDAVVIGDLLPAFQKSLDLQDSRNLRPSNKLSGNKDNGWSAGPARCGYPGYWRS